MSLFVHVSRYLVPHRELTPEELQQMLRRMRCSVLILASYWILMAVATHWPGRISSSEPPVAHLDKLVHTTGFLLLAVLWCWTIWQRKPSWKHLFLSWMVLAAYAAIDELTQYWCPYRIPDVRDWLADSVGITIGLVICFSRRNQRSRRCASSQKSPPAQHQSQRAENASPDEEHQPHVPNNAVPIQPANSWASAGDSQPG
ncbi:MAG: hypothetical protein KatS3mg109_0677 [Pirellulaceae bacterium]|nr:MAG: hypothetical protein KatS3mg109_0677 [Pirellulaceae bacterium]